MRKKREFIEGACYHVTSRTNGKTRIFERRLGQKIMLMILQEAKEKFHFKLNNFCIMPTHIHLLIEPASGTSLSDIMCWIKTRTAKRWNFIHGSIDHVWGHRFYARVIRDNYEYENVTYYIDQNPVKAELVCEPSEWKMSGSFYMTHNIPGLVDFNPNDRQRNIKLLPPMPLLVSKLLPPSQLEHMLKYPGLYIDEINRLSDGAWHLIGGKRHAPHLHYFTGNADYYIYEYDGDDLMYGQVRFAAFPDEAKFQKMSLLNLKSNQFMELDLHWTVPGT